MAITKIEELDMKMNLESRNINRMKVQCVNQHIGSMIMDVLNQHYKCVSMIGVYPDVVEVDFYSLWRYGIGIVQDESGFYLKVHDLPPLNQADATLLAEWVEDCNRAISALNIIYNVAKDKSNVGIIQCTERPNLE